MAIQIVFEKDPVERSSAVVIVSFYDYEPKLVTPKAGLNWSLYRPDGSYVNERQNVAVASDSTVRILLKGDDLPAGNLIFLIEGTYDSDLGQDIPLREEAEFYVERTVH
jgi:hypothetical protein